MGIEQLETMTMCECSDDYGPCELHGETLVQREGASLRTADELILLACQDLVDLGAELSPYGADVLAQAETTADRCRNQRTGTMWFDDEGETYDRLVTLADQLEVDLGVSVIWNDGYRIVRPAADCPLYV
jgi:hypothetical protein